MAILIHSIPKSSCSAKDNCEDQLSTFTCGPLRPARISTGIVCTVFIQLEKLMSSLVIRFGLPLDAPVLLLVFHFSWQKVHFQITFL